MASFGDLKTRTANELERDDLGTFIERAILDAVDYYADMFLGFNEERRNIVTTAGGQFVDAPDGLRFPSLITVNISGSDYELKKVSSEYVEELHNSSTTQGQPAFYCYLDGQFRLWPTPDDAFVLTVLGVYDTSALSADADTNDFTLDRMATNMLVHWAKEYIARNILLDGEMAAAAMTQRVLSERNFRQKVNRLAATGYIAPSL